MWPLGSISPEIGRGGVGTTNGRCVQGARPKALVQYDATTGQVSTRPDAPGSPWLVKFPAQNEHKEVCVIQQLK